MADAPLDESVLGILANLSEPAEIVVFTAEGCPNCPYTVRAAHALAAASPLISVTVVDASENVEMASRYQVRSVPTAVVNGDLTIIGVVTPEELVHRLVELQGPSAEDAIFISLVKSGRIADATSRLVDGQGISAFAELWNESTLEGRIGLSLTAQNAIDEEQCALYELVTLILPSLEKDDAALRGDTADLLGSIAHPSARPALERLADDNHPDVAEAAVDALASIEERARTRD